MAFTCRVQYLDDRDPFGSTVFPEPTRPPSFTFNEYLPLVDQLPEVHKFLKAPHKLEDCTLQLSHNGCYLDIDSSIDEQKEDFQGFNKERKHSLLMRSQLSVRVQGCIEKLLNSSGRELRRALFSLKQIFQDDKDLVHEFVSADGLTCLIKVGTDADQNYQNYILRALGQIMLYVDGMNGVIEHLDIVQWLYSLLSSKYRLVVKTALKLLLVFVEYTDSNAAVLYQATSVVDQDQGNLIWSNVINLLKDDGQDSEILLYAMSLLNKTLNAIPDQDTFYDVTDSLEKQDIEKATKQLMSGKGTDLDLVEQFKLYEYALKQEDGDIDIPIERKQTLRKHRRSAEKVDRKSMRRSLIPTPEYEGDMRRTRRSLDLGRGLSKKENEVIEESNKKRENRRSRPRVSLDNSFVTPPLQEKDVQELLAERRIRRRLPDQDPSSREDTSAGTTDMSASETSSIHDTPIDDDVFITRKYSDQSEASTEDIIPPSKPLLDATERTEPRETPSKYPPKQTATLPRNFSPSATASTPLTTTEYVSHRRRRHQAEDPEETVSTIVTAHGKSPDVTPSPVGDPSSNGDLSSGIAARRRQRQEQREKELAAHTQEPGIDETRPESLNNNIKQRFPVPTIREPSPEGGSDQDARTKEGMPSEVTKMANGTSSVVETGTQDISQTQTSTSTTANDVTKLRNIKNYVEPKDVSSEDSKPLRIDTSGGVSAHVKPSEETPTSAGLSSNKRYQLAMMYSSQEEPVSPSPTRKISSSLQGNDSISGRIEQLTSKESKESSDNDVSVPTTPMETGVTAGTVQAVQDMLQSPQKLEEQKPTGPMGDLSGTVSLAKKGLKSVNIPMLKPTLKPAEDDATGDLSEALTPEAKEEAAWEELLRKNCRELRINAWDFTDLTSADDKNVYTVTRTVVGSGSIPPPPPPPGVNMGTIPRPPALPMLPTVSPGHYGTLPPPVPSLSKTLINDGFNTYPPKKKKTLRLFWKETRLDRLAAYGKHDTKETIWGNLEDVTIDKRKLEHLFESKAKEILQKDQKILEAGKKQVISVLDAKRSNHINIALTALPLPTTIKQAIMKMDGTAVSKEGIEKLLMMVPSEDESNLIKESMIENPEIPLGSAEQFLHMLSNITVLKARLSLWLFKMDYESMEEEVAEPLAELKRGIEDLKSNQTFRHVLSMLLAVGNFLNGIQVEGFHIDYLAKVPDIKDTVHKQTLLYHLCSMVIEQFPDSTDLFSELASISRCAKVDFEVLEDNLQKMEEQCKASWEHLRVISKHDSHSPLKNKLQDFLSDCAQRIVVLKIVHRRVLNRFNNLLLYLGMTASAVREIKITEFCKIISEFALEYRTTRERVLEQEKKKANHRKRALTRGKMITENLTLSQDKDEDAKLKALLKNHVGTAPGDETLKTRTRQKPALFRQRGLFEADSSYVSMSDTPVDYYGNDNDGLDDIDAGQSASTTNLEDVGDEQTDEMLQILVNTAKNTRARNAPRERKRGRTNRKSLRRTLKGGTGLTEAESRALGLHPACKTGVQV